MGIEEGGFIFMGILSGSAHIMCHPLPSTPTNGTEVYWYSSLIPEPTTGTQSFALYRRPGSSSPLSIAWSPSPAVGEMHGSVAAGVS